MQSNHPSLQLFEKLLVASPSSREENLARIVKEELTQMGVPFETDLMGNVMVRLNGRSSTAPTCVFAAHMDEIGFAVNKIEPNGTLRAVRSGGLLPWKLGEGPLEILGDKKTIVGVLSMGSTHTAAAANQSIKWDNVKILTGLSVEQLTEAGVRVGSLGVPTREMRGPVLFGDPNDPLVGAWTFDDRMGVVTLIRLLKTMQDEEIRPYHPTIIAFTVQEEVGGHGAKSLAFREKADIFISVDGAPIPPETALSLDGRPAAWSKDRLAPYDQKLLADLSEAAVRAGTELQTAVFEGAASDASLVAYAGGTQRIACIGQVRENSHGYEVARLSVFDNMLNTLIEFVKSWEG